MPQKSNKTYIWVIIEIIENVGRVSTMVLPFFWKIKINSRFKIVVLLFMIAALSIYYVGWFNYFRGGRDFSILGKSILFIPLPMAICPILFLLMSGILMESWPMAIASIIFAAGHITISLR